MEVGQKRKAKCGKRKAESGNKSQRTQRLGGKTWPRRSGALQNIREREREGERKAPAERGPTERGTYGRFRESASWWRQANEVSALGAIREWLGKERVAQLEILAGSILDGCLKTYDV